MVAFFIFNNSHTKAAITLKGSVTSDFSNQVEPEFSVDTAGIIRSNGQAKALGELAPGQGKISSSLKYNGETTNQKPEISTDMEVNDRFAVKVEKTNQFKPGKYQLEVNLSGGSRSQTLTQDFTWGVLAINSNKSIYSPGETAYLQMATLNNWGHTVCNQSLRLEIQTPNSQVRTLMTDDGSIKRSSDCGVDNVTDLPDYFANFRVAEEGKYQLKLINLGNGYTVTSFFEAKDEIPFDIERAGATRINPFKASYVMSLKVKANQSINGSIKEKVPASFEVSEISGNGSIIDKNDNLQTIVWPVVMNSGDTLNLSYRYQAPQVSPQFYLIGPLEIWQATIDGDNGGAVGETIVFNEPRAWQIASDAAYTCTTTTTGSWAWATAANWQAGTTCGPTNNEYPGQTAGNTYSVVINSTGGTATVITVGASYTNLTTLTIGNTGTVAKTLDLNGFTLTFSGAVQINQTSTSLTNLINVGTGTLNAASISLLAITGTGRVARVTVATGGTINVTGSITYSASAGTNDVTFSGGGTINIGGSFLPKSLTATTVGLINANGSATQSFGAFTTYFNLDITNTAAVGTNVTFTGDATINGALNINDGNLDFAALNTTVTGATTVASGAYAVFSSSTGTKIFTGGVTVTGTWDETAAAVVTFAGGLTNNGTWTALGGVHTFSGATKIISGTTETVIPSVSITGATANTNTLTVATLLTVATGITLTNNGTVTATTALSGLGAFTNASGATLNIGAASAITTLTPAAAANTINYIGASQTVHAAATNNYWHLGFSGTGTNNVTLPASVTALSGNLTLTGTSNVTMAALLGITGNLSVGTGTTFNTGATNTWDLTVTGTTDVTGTLTLANTDTKTFTNNVTLNSGAVWNETAVAAIGFAGNLTNNATTFTASATGVHTFSGASKVISGSTITAIPSVAINAATANSNTLTVSTTLAGSNTLTQNNGATLNIGAATASMTLTGLAASTATNTVNYNGTGGQTVKATTDNQYSNLTITTGAGTATLAAGTTVNGALTITSGTLNLSTFSFTASTTSSITGVLNDSSSTGTNIFVGAITVQTGGSWTSTGGSAYEIRGGITNHATFTGGTGTYTFTTGSQILNGDFAYSFGGAVSISGAITITNQNTSTVTITGNLDGNNASSNWTNATSSYLFLGGSIFATNGTLTATASPNTVTYNNTSSGQTVKSTTYHHLTIAKTAQTATLVGAIILNGDLTITSGILDTSGTNYGITLAGNWTNSGTFTPNGGTVTFNKSSSSQTLNSGGVGAGKIFNNLTHSGAGTLQLITSAINIDGIFTNSAGTFDANDLNMNVADDFLISGGSFAADVSPGATTQTVTLDGTNEATVSGSSTFRNLTTNTTTDGAKTIKFTAGTTQTIGNTWTLDGDIGKVLTLRSTSDTNTWYFVIPADINPSGDYIDVKDSQNTTNAYRITAGANYVDSGNNVPGWLFAPANTPPNIPSSLVQKKVTGGTTLATGDWTNETQVQFTATASDTDNPDTLYLCVEKDVLATAFSSTNGGDLCGTGVAYSGTPVTVSVTITGMTDASEYHWQAQVKDAAAAYSSFVTYGGNTENPPTNPAARDFGIDTTAPTGGTVNDGTGADVGYNDGSLSALSANWSGVDPTASGLLKYEYAIGTTVGGTDTKTWTDNTTSTAVTTSGLTLRTGQTYYFTIRTTDNATNVSTAINSNGQAVAATLTFSYFSGSSITFTELNSGNSYTDSAKTTVLQTSTNAYGGYIIKARAIDKLRHTGISSNFIAHFRSGGIVPNSTPEIWTGNGFGYTTSDDNLSGGTADRFTNGGPKYAGFIETKPGDPVADHTASVSGTPISNEQFTITYRVTGSFTNPAGKYSTTIIYTCIPQY